jgi:hypothetical protein
LNFSCCIHSCRVHIHAIFTCVHALMHWHDSQRYTTISCSSSKSCALTVTVVAVQHMMWGLETVLHKNLRILAYLLYHQLNYLSVSLHWYWKILNICVSSWCSCWRLSLLGCDTLSLGKQFVIFWRTVVFLYLGQAMQEIWWESSCSEFQELVTQWRSVTYQKTWPFWDIAVRISHLAWLIGAWVRFLWQ